MSFTHVVKQGEYLSLIALHYGFADWRTIYDHPDNAEFRRLRPNPNLIYPGDRLAIPDLGEGDESGGTDERHRFRTSRPRRELRVTFLDIFQRPLRNLPLDMKLDSGEQLEIQTDGRGSIHVKLPLESKRAKAQIAGYEFDLLFSHLDPPTTVSGIQARLNNLGHWVGRVDGIYGPLTAGGMASFQRSEVESGLEVGEFGQPERDSIRRLAVVHDGEDTVGEEEITGRFYQEYEVTDSADQSEAWETSSDDADDDPDATQSGEDYADPGEADGEEADEPDEEWV